MRNYMETDWKYGIKINHHLSTIVWSESLYIRVTALSCQVQRSAIYKIGIGDNP